MTVTSMTPDRRLARVAARQFGLLTSADARRAGLSRHQIRSRVESGRWRSMGVGVYLLNGVPPSEQQRTLAACLAGPVNAVASHLSAAFLFGLVTAPSSPHITVPTTASCRNPRAVVHRSEVSRIERTTVCGVPATTPARTLVDRRQGAAAMRDALEPWSLSIRFESAMEVRLFRRLRSWGFADPQGQYVVRDFDGRFVARMDLAWPERCFGLEYIGELAHSPRRARHDETRLDRLRALGWWVEEVDRFDLRPSATRLPALLTRALGRKRPR